MGREWLYLCHLGGAQSRRQNQAHGGSRAHLAFDVDLPLERGHDTVNDGQAEAGSFAHRFGSEEGVEDPWHDVGWDAHAAVLDLNDGPTRPVGGGGNTDLVVGYVALRDGLSGIDEKVEKHLRHARLVGVDHRRLAILAHDLGAVLDLVARHAQGGFHDGADVDWPDPFAPAPGRE